MSASFRHKSDCSVQKSMSGSHFCDPEPGDPISAVGQDRLEESSLPRPTHPPSSNFMTTSISVPVSLTVKEIREARASSFQGTGLPLDSLDPLEEEVGRETWNKKLDFILSVIGFAVDLSNVRLVRFSNEINM